MHVKIMHNRRSSCSKYDETVYVVYFPHSFSGGLQLYMCVYVPVILEFEKLNIPTIIVLYDN
jgi:hypothetical protein